MAVPRLYSCPSCHGLNTIEAGPGHYVPGPAVLYSSGGCTICHILSLWLSHAFTNVA